MTNKEQKTSGTVEQPFMSTATSEAGFNKNKKNDVKTYREAKNWRNHNG